MKAFCASRILKRPGNQTNFLNQSELKFFTALPFPLRAQAVKSALAWGKKSNDIGPEMNSPVKELQEFVWNVWS